MKYIFLIFPLFYSSISLSEELEHWFGGGALYVEFDEQIISKEELSKCLVVHPVAYDTNYYVFPSLGLCVDTDEYYYRCGSRNWDDPNFYKNAELNIKKGEEYIRTLSTLNRYNELDGLVDYLRSSMEFGLWQSRRLLQYYSSWDTDALDKNYRHFDFKQKVENILAALRSANSIEAKWQLSTYEWATTVNHVYRDNEGNIPVDGWKRFATKYKLSERIVWHEG